MAIGFCLLAEKLAVVRPGVLSPVNIPLRSALVVEVQQYYNHKFKVPAINTTPTPEL